MNTRASVPKQDCYWVCLFFFKLEEMSVKVLGHRSLRRLKRKASLPTSLARRNVTD